MGGAETPKFGPIPQFGDFRSSNCCRFSQRKGTFTKKYQPEFPQHLKPQFWHYPCDLSASLFFHMSEDPKHVEPIGLCIKRKHFLRMTICIYTYMHIYIYTYIHIYIYTYIQWRSKRSDQVNVHVACKDRQSLLMFMLLASTRDKSWNAEWACCKCLSVYNKKEA